MTDVFYIIDNALCMLGAISLLIAIIITLKTETSTPNEQKKSKMGSYHDMYKITLICSIISVASFILFGLSMYIQTRMW